MRGRLRSVVAGRAAVIVCLMATLVRADDAKEPRRYELSFQMNVKMTTVERKQSGTLKGEGKFLYSLKPVAGGVEVSMSEMSIATAGDATAPSRFRMSRQGFEDLRSGTLTVQKYEKASPKLQALLDTFDSPLVTIALDQDGGEVSRRILAKASPLLAEGVIENTRVFHVRFPKSQERWDAPVVLPMAGGQAARGKLQFEKAGPAPSAPPGAVRVKVSGQLAAEGKAPKGEIRNGVYRVAGEQVYDPALHDWLNGSWTIDASWDMLQEGIMVGSAAGWVKIALKGPEAKTATAR